ncbi:MAG: Signal-transduction histidine kinase senX3 [Arcobacter lacus]|nr:MAG: Signal-transduction histidine kinase senX3 [Arcobacter lacus]
MVIDLTNSEKSTFIRFLGLYLGSSFILIALVCFFYYKTEKQLYFDLTKSKMQNEVSKISSQIIFAHMTNTKLNTSEFIKTDKYKVSFYNEKKEKIFGNLDDEIDFSKNIIQHHKHFILVDHSTLGHLGVYYIAIEENLHTKQVKELEINIIVFFLLIYSIISLIGFYLAKLFLKPIKIEREKINNFIKDTTHELNTPISAIMMSTENNNLTEKQIERVRLSAIRISEIYKDLTYIFLEKSDEKKVTKNLRLDLVIKEQLIYFKPLALKKRININLKLEKFEYSINKDDFIRLLNNLISNAIKYNKISGNIDISLKNNELKISDTGIGINKNKLKDIYKRYYRATNEQGGFGLGLNIVNHVCNENNISIKVDSKENKSTTFTLKF